MVVIAAALIIGLGKIISLISLAAFHHFGRQNIAGGHFLAAEIKAVIEQADGVAGLQIIQIEHIGKQFVERFADFHRNAGLRHRTTGGSAHHHGAQRRHGFHGELGSRSLPLAVYLFNRHEVALAVVVIVEKLNVGGIAAGIQAHAHGLAGAQLLEFGVDGAFGQHLLDAFLRHVQAGEHIGERIARLHGLFGPIAALKAARLHKHGRQLFHHAFGLIKAGLRQRLGYGISGHHARHGQQNAQKRPAHGLVVPKMAEKSKMLLNH